MACTEGICQAIKSIDVSTTNTHNQEDDADEDVKIVWDSSTSNKHASSSSPQHIEKLLTLASTQFQQGKYSDAFNTCKQGESLCMPNADGYTPFTTLMDDIAVYAAARGNLIGYTGRLLEVRSAGEDAWLGRPAPYDPALDGHLTEENALPSDDLSLLSASTPKQKSLSTVAAAAGAITTTTNTNNNNKNTKNTTNTNSLATWHYSDSLTASMNQRTSFRCLKEAITAAKDGDRIILRQGIHNGLGESVVIKKRVLIQGEGQLGDTTVDQRANCPTVRIERGGVVLSNIYFDHTGFSEAICFASQNNNSTAVHGLVSLVEHCKITCSGDDAMNTSNTSSPWIRSCTITGKKVGIRSFDRSSPKIEGCIIEKCGEQGIKAMESSLIHAYRCTVTSSNEDGVVAMNSSSITLHQCAVTSNKGPGVDCSDTARVVLRECKVMDNVGGVWLWDESSVEMDGCVVDGGCAHVILADTTTASGSSNSNTTNGNTRMCVCSSCTIKGTVHAADDVWKKGLLKRKNTFIDPDGATDFPSEHSDPFRFVPRPYTPLR